MVQNLVRDSRPSSPAFCRMNRSPQTTSCRLTLANLGRLHCCISKQHTKGMAVNLYEIEDTSFWLGTPTRLETIKHYASMLEEDIQYLKRQLLAARDNISTLAEMNDQLNTNLQKHRKRMAKVESETTDQLAEIQSLSMVRD